jgi:HK97 family phage major capsid protein
MPATLTTPREQLEKLSHDMEALAVEHAAKAGGPTAEDMKELDAMAGQVTALIEVVRGTAQAGKTLDMAKAFLGDLGSAAVPAGPGPGQVDGQSGIINATGMTLGEAVAKSPGYQDFLKQWRGTDGRIVKGNGSMRVALQETGSLYGGRPDRKALVTGVSATSAGAYIQNALLGETVDLIGERELTVRDLCTNIQIETDTFEYVTITGKTNAAAPVLEATTSATPGLNNVAVGAYTAAHGVKPESALVFAVVTAAVETIAHLIPVTRRAAADAPQLMALINAFLLYGLREEEEDQILNGNGTSPNLRGILQTVGINTVGSAGTDLDAIVDAIAAIRVDRRRPTAMVIHPNDWYSTGFLTAKDGVTGGYLMANPAMGVDQLNTLWGLAVVVTEAMTENTVLVGDFRQYVVADRMQGTIYVTDSHNDWFARNLLAVLAEERLAGGCLDPEAFCTVTAV